MKQLIALLLIFLCCQGVYAQGKLQSWNTHQREKSQRLVSAATTALNKGFIDKAAPLLIQATVEDPSDPAPYNMLGMTYIRQGKYGEALESLKKGYQIEKNAEMLLSTGFAYYLQHDYDAAISSWSRALERDPSLAEANGDIAFAYMRKGDFAKADEYFHALTKSRTGSQLGFEGLAVLNYLAGNFATAKKAADLAHSIRPYFPVLLLQAKLDFLLGDPVAGQKRVSEWARASANKKALLRPMTAIGYPTQHDFNWDPFLVDNFDTGRLLLARSKTLKKDTSSKSKIKATVLKGKALDALTRAKNAHFVAPQDFYILRELALLELANGDYSNAADHFREVLQICPACVVDWLHLARALSMQDKTSEASYAVREFQRLRPNEKISPSFLDLAAGTPTAIPDLSPQPVNVKEKRNKEGESGF